MSSLGDQAWAITTLIEAADMLVGEAGRRLKEQAGMTVAEKEVLFRLTLNGGAMRMSALAKALLFSPSGATRLVDRMIGAGLLERTQGSDDRRATTVTVTPAGKRAFARTGPIMASVVNDLFSPYVNDQDIAHVTRIMTKILEAGSRWEERDAGLDFEAAIRQVGQPSVRAYT